VLSLFVEVVPYSRRAPERALYGAFDVSGVSMVLESPASPRLLKLDAAAVVELVKDFDATKIREALSRFQAYMEEKSGAKAQLSEPAKQMQEATFVLLSDLQRAVVSKKGMVCLR